MMKWMAGLLVGLSVALGLAGCDGLCANVDCDPGGGGGVGGGNFSFARGLVFVRGGDLYLSDRSDYSAAEPLSSGEAFVTPSLSPDGRSVVAATAGRTRLVRLSVGSSSTATLLQAGGPFTELRNPVFTPDGQSVLFVYNSGTASYIGRVAADGSGGAELLVGGSSMSYGSPSFDRQGRLVVAAGTDRTALDRIVAVNPSSGQEVGARLPLGNSAQRVVNRAQVSPDGTRVAFDGQLGTGASGLFVLSLSSGMVSPLSIGRGNHTFPTWQGNDTLAFSSDAGGSDVIYTVAATGGSPTLAVPGDQPFYGPN